MGGGGYPMKNMYKEVSLALCNAVLKKMCR